MKAFFYGEGFLDRFILVPKFNRANRHSTNNWVSWRNKYLKCHISSSCSLFVIAIFPKRLRDIKSFLGRDVGRSRPSTKPWRTCCSFNAAHSPPLTLSKKGDSSRSGLKVSKRTTFQIPNLIGGRASKLYIVKKCTTQYLFIFIFAAWMQNGTSVLLSLFWLLSG